jgi:hypothetical protein
MSSKMKKIKYLTFRMRSCSNRVIELNLIMLILKKICDEILFVSCQDEDTDVEYLQKWRK